MYSYDHELRRWNETAKDCYMRGCICKGCPIYELYFKNSIKKCQMKGAVVELVRKFGIPEDLTREDTIQD